ncbi:MAG: hypothetical protein ACUVXI_01615 [bacterium]
MKIYCKHCGAYIKEVGDRLPYYHIADIVNFESDRHCNRKKRRSRKGSSKK